MPLVAVPIALVGIVLQCVIGMIHARASGDRAIRRRLPKPFALNDQDSVLLHIVQLTAFLLIPVVGTIVLFVKFLAGSYCRQASDPSVSGCGTGGHQGVGIDLFRTLEARSAPAGRQGTCPWGA
ncbi:hypothetical protein VQH23_12225 [Pararoseomonas sp. SCSIO 73927]|uniref:hypothetical protein n=1 Tax=Pararoseomonas sp. SCSIO 73927 TaxID=3114537 RepID=UPI0030D3EF34